MTGFRDSQTNDFSSTILYQMKVYDNDLYGG